MSNSGILGFNFKETKYKFYYLLCGGLICGVYWRLILLMLSIDIYYKWGEYWNTLGAICGLFSPLFCILSILIFRKEKYRTFYLNFNWLLIGALLLLLISDDLIYIFVINCLIAAIIGLIVPSYISMAGFLTLSKYRGRVSGILTAIGLLLAAFLFFLSQILDFTILIVIIAIVLFVLTILNKNLLKKKEEIFDLSETVDYPNSNRVLSQFIIVFFSMLFVLGLLFSKFSVIFPTIGPFVTEPITEGFFYQYFDFLMMIFLLGWGVLSLVSGSISDRLGRKSLMIISIISYFITIFGILSQSLGVPLIPSSIILIIMTFCVSTCLVLVIVIGGDIFARGKMYSAYAISLSALLTGLFIGIIIGSVVIDQRISFVVVSIGLLFVLVLFIGYTKETLPSKQELEWREAILSFYCISQNGICIYKHDFKEEKIIDADLLAGGISGIISLVQVMIQSDKKTKIIDQEDVKLLIEFGENVTCVIISRSDLRIIRRKLIALIEEIEFLFKDIFSDWSGEITSFKPIGKLLEKHFK